MPARFSESGVAFQYPENWTLEREEIDGGWTVIVQSPDTSFFLLCRRDDCPTPEELSNQALADLQETYPDLEVEPASSKIANRITHGFDVRFFLFDLTNTVWIRSFRTPSATLLAMWQANDLELEKTEAVLRAIAASVRVAEDQ